MVTSQTSNKRKYVAISLLAATIIISVAGSVFLIRHYEYVSHLQNQGYVGLFLISLLAGSPIPIPTPSMILTFTMGSLLDPVLVGLVSGLGNGAGNALIYLTGRGGLVLFPNLDFSNLTDEAYSSRLGRFIRKLKIPKLVEFANRRGTLAIFVLSIYPNPVLTPMILGMGAARFSFTKFFFACLAGKMVQSFILAYLGYYGLRSLLRFMGVFDVP